MAERVAVSIVREFQINIAIDAGRRKRAATLYGDIGLPAHEYVVVGTKIELPLKQERTPVRASARMDEIIVCRVPDSTPAGQAAGGASRKPQHDYGAICR